MSSRTVGRPRGSRTYTEQQKQRKKENQRKREAERTKREQAARAKANKDLSLDDALKGADIDEKHAQDERVRLMKQKLDEMDDEALTRFEFYYRAHFQKEQMRSRLEQALPHRQKEITDEMAIVVGGLSKLFLGELVETAMNVLRESGSVEQGLQPSHIEEAARRLKQEGKFGKIPDKAFLFSAAGLKPESLPSEPDAEMCAIDDDFL